MTDQNYLLDNAWRQAAERLDAVERFLDPGTIRVLAGIGIEKGWRCLEAGAGGGSIASWLAERVGATGSVVATDIDTRLLAARVAANIEVRRHHIVADPLDEKAFDLVHARLLLEHLPQRDAVLAKLARALRPGGWLVIESVDYISAIPVSEHGAREHERSQAFRLREFATSGARVDYGRELPALMQREGLKNVGNEGRVVVMEGGSPAATWFRLSMAQLRGRLVGADKLSDAEVDRMLELFEDPRWAALSPIIFAAWGQASNRALANPRPIPV
jgi:ubiquinone/menaquinone biosynthesis C-methylase UbiE